MVQFVDVGNVIDLVAEVGVEPLLIELAGYIEDDFRRWPVFEKGRASRAIRAKASSS